MSRVAFVIVLFMLPSLSTCKILLPGTVALPPPGSSSSSSSSNESLALSTTLLPTKSSIAPRSITLHHSVLAFDSLVNSLLNQWLLVRLLGCIVQLGVRVGFLRPKSWCPIVKSSPSNKRFLNAAQLALEKTDLYGARVLPSMDVYEWRGQGHQNAGAMTEAQILLVTSELLEIAEIAPVEMTAALPLVKQLVRRHRSSPWTNRRKPRHKLAPSSNRVNLLVGEVKEVER